MNESKPSSRISGRVWTLMTIAFILILALTIYKDWALTGDQPNIWFYIFVPAVSMLGSILAGYGLIWTRSFPISIGDAFFVILTSEFVGQVYENITKLIYYRIWSYPGWLYILGFLPLIFLVPGILLVRWWKVRWSWALLLSLAFFVGGLVLSLGFMAITGLDTPGS